MRLLSSASSNRVLTSDPSGEAFEFAPEDPFMEGLQLDVNVRSYFRVSSICRH